MKILSIIAIKEVYALRILYKDIKRDHCQHKRENIHQLFWIWIGRHKDSRQLRDSWLK